MSKPRNNNANKGYTKKWNNDRNTQKPRRDENFLDYFKPNIEVRNGDIGKALRILKKRLERNEFQKDIARMQYHEKPSETKRRSRQQAQKRWKRHVAELESAGEHIQYTPVGLKNLKSKRKMRKLRDQQDRLRRRRNSR